MPNFEVTLDESVAILKQVLPLMSQQRVPTIPQNYAVWYDYVSSTTGELRSEIQRHLDVGNEFSPELCRRIYEKYFLDEIRAEVDSVQHAVREAVEASISELTALGEDISHFSTVLDDTGAKLEGDITRETLKTLITELARETSITKRRSANAEMSLQMMAEELTELRAQVNALTRDSQTDALTGVGNRRAFDAALERLIQEAAAEDQTLCLIMVDIDRFKLFNDTFGHLVGDQVLRFVAQEMQQCVKGRDVLARFGGEEFGILLPNTPLEGALMLAESIRVIIESQPVRSHGGSEIDPVTISLGVAQFMPGEDASSFIARADECLYKSKDDGRNSVTGEMALSVH